ncbi:MAG: mandelate racemase/muconate lactonizing enzyme family protein [Planctomycetota bacterium]|jgi:galactonate dehydratase|nr:mandelate racemase/muconate lactonizing enzyme family protein [Planctomycetota bacterium]
MGPPIITKIETIKYCIGWIDWVFVKVVASDGVHGWGEGSLHGPIAPVLAAIKEYADHLVGQEATGAERHWYRLYNAWRWRGGAVYSTAMSAIDLALWDMEARRLEVPLCRLFGGPHRTKLPVYASHWMQGVKDADDACKRARQAIDMGFRGFKWCPFNFELLRSDFAGAIQRVRELMAAAREGAGPGAEIYIECSELLSPRTAPVMIDAMLPYRPAWIEEPFPFENPGAIARLQNEIPIPVAVGERLLSRYEFRELLEKGGCRVVQPDLMHGGGFTEVRRIAAMAETYQVTVAPHNPGGPVCTAASMHLAAATPNFLVLEQIEPDRALRDTVSTHPIELVDGHFHLSGRPGLGLEPDLNALPEEKAANIPRLERGGSLLY